MVNKIKFNINMGQGEGYSIEEAITNFDSKKDNDSKKTHLILTAFDSKGQFVMPGKTNIKHLDLSVFADLEVVQSHNVTVDYLDVSKNLKLKEIVVMYENGSIKNGSLNPDVFKRITFKGMQFDTIAKMIKNYRSANNAKNK